MEKNSQGMTSLPHKYWEASLWINRHNSLSIPVHVQTKNEDITYNLLIWLIKILTMQTEVDRDGHKCK